MRVVPPSSRHHIISAPPRAAARYFDQSWKQPWSLALKLLLRLFQSKSSSEMHSCGFAQAFPLEVFQTRATTFRLLNSEVPSLPRETTIRSTSASPSKQPLGRPSFHTTCQFLTAIMKHRVTSPPESLVQCPSCFLLAYLLALPTHFPSLPWRIVSSTL